MQIAIVGAGFTPEEADRLRRALATFKKTGTIHTFRERFLAGMAANGYPTRLRRALLQPDRGLRRVRLPREPRGELRAPRLRLGLAQVPPPGGLRLRAPELPADGLLRPGADRPRRRGARRRGAAGLRQRQLLGQRARARRQRRAGAPARLPPDQSACARTTPPGSLPPAATAIATSRRSGVGRARRRGCSRMLAEADAFAALGLDRREALWQVGGDRRGRAAAALRRARERGGRDGRFSFRR